MGESDNKKSRQFPKRSDAVSWQGLFGVALAVTGAATPLWWSYESGQNAAINSKADRSELDSTVTEVVTEVRLLRADVNALLMKLIKVAEAKAQGPPPVVGQLQTQEIHVTDMIGEAIQKEFTARMESQPHKQYPPCVVGGTDELQRFGVTVSGQATGTGDGDGAEGGGRCGAGRGRNIHADVYATGREP